MRTFLIGSFFISLCFSQGLYQIAEPDLLAEIEQRMSRVQARLQKEVERTQKNMENFQIGDRVLPLAQRSRTYEVSTEYTLEFDIPRVDDRGRVIGTLYPKGYRYNPLFYMPVDPPVLIVFDGQDNRQVRYVKKILPQYPYRFLIATRGEYFKLLETFGERVFFFHPKIREKFRITQAVSVVKWDRKKGKAIVEVHGCDRVDCRGVVSNKP